MSSLQLSRARNVVLRPFEAARTLCYVCHRESDAVGLKRRAVPGRRVETQLVEINEMSFIIILEGYEKEKLAAKSAIARSLVRFWRRGCDSRNSKPVKFDAASDGADFESTFFKSLLAMGRSRVRHYC